LKSRLALPQCAGYNERQGKNGSDEISNHLVFLFFCAIGVHANNVWMTMHFSFQQQGSISWKKSGNFLLPLYKICNARRILEKFVIHMQAVPKLFGIDRDFVHHTRLW